MPVSRVTQSTEEASDGPKSGFTRVTVNLNRKSAKALKELQAHTGDNQTDIINRALQVYWSLTEELKPEGAKLLIQNGETATGLKIL